MDLSNYSATDHSARFGHFRGAESAGAGQLRLYTDSVERLRIDADGRVGIGTTSPGAKLDIKGDGADFFLQSADYKIARIQPRGTGADLDRGLFSLFNGNTENVRIDTAGSSWLNGGSVGIGTTTPGYKLHVVGDNDAGIIAERNTSGSEGRIFMLAGSTENVIASKGSGNNPKQLNFTMGVAPKVSIDTSGNVGIGTTSPSAKLEVAGGGVLISNGQYYTAKSNTGGNYKLAAITTGNVVAIGAIDYTTAGTIFVKSFSVTVTPGLTLNAMLILLEDCYISCYTICVFLKYVSFFGISFI
jgi:hypothetical protein